MNVPFDLVARFECLPGRRAEVIGLLADYGRYVRANPQTARFEAYTDHEHPDCVVVIERYTSRHAFDAHLADPENLRFNEQISTLIKRRVVELAILEPAEDAPC